MPAAHLGVLIVERHPIMALALTELLRGLGHVPVASVRTGVEAIGAAATHRPDLMLLDATLTGSLDGVETATTIQNRFGIPAVFFSTDSDHVTRERAHAARPLAFIDKTAPPAEIVSVVARIASNARLTRKFA